MIVTIGHHQTGMLNDILPAFAKARMAVKNSSDRRSGRSAQNSGHAQ